MLITASLLGGCGVNTIPTYEQNAKAAWSEVLNQYKRRSDLIPNLVESVKGFADQERNVLTQVTEARSKATSRPGAGRHPDQSGSDEAIPGCAEHPRRRAQAAHGRGRTLSWISSRARISSPCKARSRARENRIAIARRDYIQAVRQYNTEITTFPGRLWKMVLYPSAKEMAAFDIPPEEIKTPKVDFGTEKK